MTKILPYARQSINKSDIDAVKSALKSEMITRGEIVEQFEKAVAEYCNVKYAVAFNSGTASLQAAYQSVNLNPNDRLITTPNTFVSTAGAAIQRGVNPIFVDIDRDSGNMDLEAVQLNQYKSFTRGRTVIVPVHFAGNPVDMEAMNRFLRDPDTIIIEDASHAWGATYKDGQKMGSCPWSDMTIFSLHPAKNITMGEGGVVTTNNPDLYELLKRFRNNGIVKKEEESPWHYDVVELSGNYHVTDFSAALGMNQLKRLDEFVEKRRKLVKIYREKLAKVPHINLFSEEYDAISGCHLFVVQIDFDHYETNRTDVMNALKEKGVGSQYHYIPIYRFSFLKYKAGDLSEYFPEMEDYYRQGLSLPLYYDLTEENVAHVADSLCKVLGCK